MSWRYVAAARGSSQHDLPPLRCTLGYAYFMTEAEEKGRLRRSPLLYEGEWVESFKIIRLVGSGGMGEVYLARDTKLSRKVALKVIRPKIFQHKPILERFLYEAKVTAQFSHPHIVTLFTAGEHRGLPYVVLEYLEGQTLRERMAAGPLPWRDCIQIGLAIAKALTEAHRHQILHRDLKPENVIIPPDGRLRVLDFGLARVVPDENLGIAQTLDSSQTESSQSLLPPLTGSPEHGISGSPLYMAPEQWHRESCTGAADIWALGIILYELLTGAPPFQGDTIFIVASQVVAEKSVPVLPAPSRKGDSPCYPELAALL